MLTLNDDKTRELQVVDHGDAGIKGTVTAIIDSSQPLAEGDEFTLDTAKHQLVCKVVGAPVEVSVIRRVRVEFTAAAPVSPPVPPPAT